MTLALFNPGLYDAVLFDSLHKRCRIILALNVDVSAVHCWWARLKSKCVSLGPKRRRVGCPLLVGNLVEEYQVLVFLFRLVCLVLWFFLNVNKIWLENNIAKKFDLFEIESPILETSIQSKLLRCFSDSCPLAT